MNDSLGSTIEKIKLQEQDKEAKLKEKREIEAAVVSLNRAIRETVSQTEKSEQEQKLLSNNIDSLRTQVMLEKIRLDALMAQSQAFSKELEELRIVSNEGISHVWEQRSYFCEAMHNASDNYDVWALLMKPACVEQSVVIDKKEEYAKPILNNDNRLQAAIERRNKALKERDLLKDEPDNGEEFLR